MDTRTKENYVFRTSLFGFVFFVGLVSRLYFHDTNVFFFDGDEAVSGIMALDMLDGKLPIYYYGQNYGLAIIETCLISLGILFFGTSMMAIKIPMLVLWLIAIFILGLTLEKLLKEKKWWTFLFLTVLILSPAWLVWSMKARGGYLSSFLFSNIILYYLVAKWDLLKSYNWLIIGVLTLLLYEFQPVWLPGTLPPILLTLHKKWNFKNLLFFVVGIVGAFASLIPLKEGLLVVHERPQLNIHDLYDRLSQMPSRLVNSMQGDYFLSFSYNESDNLYAYIFLTLLVLSIALFVKNQGLRLTISWSWAFLASMLSSLGAVIIDPDSPRYLLPFSAFLMLFMARTFYESKTRVESAIVWTSAVVLIIFGLLSLPKFTNYSFVNMSVSGRDEKTYNDLDIMQDLIRYLHKRNISYVLSTNQFLQYQINYLTRGDILAVGHVNDCRTPENLKQVWKNYPKNTKIFGLIGFNFSGVKPTKDQEAIEIIQDKIYVIQSPDMKVLQLFDFVDDARHVLLEN